MQEYVYIKEQMGVLNIEKKLLKLSENFKDKKVAIFGLNSALKALFEEFDLKNMFNIIGISDFNLPEQVEFIDDIKILSLDNLYFSSIDLLINLSFEGEIAEKYLRKNNIVKKRIKIINLLEKTFKDKAFNFFKILKFAFSAYNHTGQISSVIKELFDYKLDFAEARLNYLKKSFSLMQNVDKPLRVMFIVFDYKKWFLSDLYFKLRADKAFKMLPIVVLPDTLDCNKNNSTEETLKYLKENGYDCIDGIEHDSNNAVMIEALKPDIIIYPQTDYLKADYTPNKMSKFALTCCVDSDFTYEKDKNFSKLQFDRLGNTWKLYSSDRNISDLFKNTVNAGFPLFDRYNKTSDINVNLWNNTEALTVCKIIYSQSFLINENFDKQQFIEYQNSMLDYAKSHKQFNFVFVPDKDLKKQCLENNILSDVEFESYINKWQELPNAVVKDNISAVSFYKSSDIFITDSIYNGFEYFPVGKPIILLKNNSTVEFNNIGENIFKSFYKLQTIEPLDIVLEDLMLAKNDYNSEIRNSILKKYKDYFFRESSDIIMNDLKMSLGRIETFE